MNARPTQKVFYSLDRATSTQDMLREYVQSKRPEAITIIKAEHQSHGRGQGDRSWHSFGRKALQQSAYFPRLRHSSQSPFVMHLLVSISLVRAIHRLVPSLDLRIKWPNDLYLNDKKVAGILLHNTIRDHHITDTIVGVGINLEPSDVPEELTRAGFIGDHTDTVIDSQELSEIIINELGEMLYAINQDAEKLRAEYNQLLYQRGEVQRFSVQGKALEAIVKEVDTHGKLVLTHDHQDHHYDYINIIWEL